MMFQITIFIGEHDLELVEELQMQPCRQGRRGESGGGHGVHVLRQACTDGRTRTVLSPRGVRPDSGPV